MVKHSLPEIKAAVFEKKGVMINGRFVKRDGGGAIRRERRQGY